MTSVRTFRANSMREALDLVRTEMGSDAVILHTRQVELKRFLPWSRRREEVEITAGVGVNVRPTLPVRPRPSRVTAQPAVPAVKSADTTPAVGRVSGPSEIGRTKEPPYKAAADGVSLELSAPPVPSEPTPPGFAAMQQQLDAIQEMLGRLGIGQPQPQRTTTAELPEELRLLRSELLAEEIEEDLADDLLQRLQRDATPSQLRDVSAARALLTATVESELRVGRPITLENGRRKVVALVGATGVGKTTTIAKLAANFRLREGVKMGLVTVDTYRIAAVEQLRTYAEIIDLPMKVVTNPIEMRRALDELVGLDLVLVDTAGRSPRDDLQIQELKRLLAAANVDEVHLVLNVTSSRRSLLASAEKFAAANATSMILTKLDEATELGALLSLSKKVGLPVSYLTTGQDVPDDIEPARADRLARLVLGRDRVG